MYVRMSFQLLIPSMQHHQPGWVETLLGFDRLLERQPRGTE